MVNMEEGTQLASPVPMGLVGGKGLNFVLPT